MSHCLKLVAFEKQGSLVLCSVDSDGGMRRYHLQVGRLELQKDDKSWEFTKHLPDERRYLEIPVSVQPDNLSKAIHLVKDHLKNVVIGIKGEQVVVLDPSGSRALDALKASIWLSIAGQYLKGKVWLQEQQSLGTLLYC